MIETTVQYLAGTAFEATARGHRIVCDQPPANGGADSGMTPPEFLLVSLGTCAAYYALYYLKSRNLPAEGLQVHVAAEKATGRPARLASFRIEITVPGLEDERHVEGVLRAAKACLIHHTLEHPPAIDIALNAPAAAPAEAEQLVGRA